MKTINIHYNGECGGGGGVGQNLIFLELLKYYFICIITDVNVPALDKSSICIQYINRHLLHSLLFFN